MNWRLHSIVVLALLALTAVLYFETLDDEWHFDDRSEITPGVRDFSPSIDGSHYRGLTVRWLWAIDYRLYGDDPAGYHVTNGLIHAGNAILVYWIAAMLASAARGPGRRVLPGAWFGAVATAAVFCAHPLGTQSVTYLTQRSTSLAAFFLLLGLGGWIRFRSGGRIWSYAASLLGFAIGLHAKHVVLMLPAVILAFELLFRTPGRRRALLLLLPLVVLAGWRSYEYLPSVQRGFRPAPPVAGSEAASSASEHGYSSVEYAFTQPRVAATYLRLFVWPRGQNLAWDVQPSRSPAEPAVLGSLAILIAMVVGARVARRHHRPVIAFGVLLFLLALIPTSSFVRSGDLLFEHRAYLPMAGLSLAAGDLVGLARGRWPRASLLGLIGLLVALSGATVRRNAVWDSEASLWADVVSKSPARARGHHNLAMARQRQGRLDLAAARFRIALQVEPGHVAAMNGLGNVLRREGRPAEAGALFRRAIERSPGFLEPRINLGNLALDRGDFVGAELLYRDVLRLAPNDATARYNLAKALEEQERWRDAIVEYESLIAVNPANAEVVNDLGAARLLGGDAEAAEIEFRRAVALRGDWETPWYNLGLALESQGRGVEAGDAFRRALAIAPGWEPARERLARLVTGK